MTSTAVQPTESPFRVAHAIGNTYQVARDRWVNAGRSEPVVVSTHDGREAAEHECGRRNRARKVIR